MKVGETGVTIRTNLGFDSSSNTELTNVFIRPDGTSITKTSADGVTLGTTTITQKVNDVDTTFTANEYTEYESEDIFNVSGAWKSYGIYDNTGSSPSDHFIGDTFELTVEDPGKVY